MPSKHEHIVTCTLSRRQRELYDEFMSRTKTRETIAAGKALAIVSCPCAHALAVCVVGLADIASNPQLFSPGNYMNVINILMQLRKVCNHPNLFAEPQVGAPLVLSHHPLRLSVPSTALSAVPRDDSGGWPGQLSRCES